MCIPTKAVDCRRRNKYISSLFFLSFVVISHAPCISCTAAAVAAVVVVATAQTRRGAINGGKKGWMQMQFSVSFGDWANKENAERKEGMGN